MDLQKIKEYAIHCHASTNHQYGGDRPYFIHLQMVVDTALSFIDIVPEKHRDAVVAASWCHDVIEDARQTYNDVLNATGDKYVAELVYALTNEKGRNRSERANDKYYAGIRSVPHAVFVKLCDRIANVEYSRKTGSRMLEMYRNENDDFVGKLLQGDPMLEWYYIPMITYLSDLFENQPA